ncbi:MAG: hypothetical protein O3C32_03370 [Bacteroidetes bacterium]|nr:hypothetical protein [Bacteroidota bacterium]
MDDTFEAGDSFFHLLNDDVAQRVYHPESVAPTDDGLVMLSATGQWDPHLAWLDANGDFRATWTPPSSVIHPAHGFAIINGLPHFVCMDRASLAPIVFAVQGHGQAVEVARLPGGQYPLFLGTDNSGNPMLVTYNRNARQTVLHLLSPTWAIIKSKGYNNYQEIDEIIYDYLTRTEIYPFFGGQNSKGEYYFNGFVNYSYSFLVLDGNLNQTALYQGTQYKGGVAMAMPNAQGWLLHRFLNNDMYLNWSAQVGNGVFTAQDLGGEYLFNWRPKTRVCFKPMLIQNRQYTVIGYSGTDGQIHLQFYSPLGIPVVTYDLGSSGVSSIADMYIDQDNGIVILGKFMVAGQFTRPGVFKLDADEVVRLLNLPEEE